MPKLKPGTILPTPEEDEAITKAAMADADTFHPTEENLKRLEKVATIRGRPFGSVQKTQLIIRPDNDVAT